MHPDQPALAAEALAQTLDGNSDGGETPSGPSKRPLVTQRLGRFAVLRLLGEGGMGIVFAAYDEQLDRRVAVKLLRQSDAEAELHRQRVLREAQAMARVAHENVVQVYDVGQIAGQIFIAMEFIDGVTLGAWQRQEDRSWQERLGVYLQAARGLAAAHQTGLVHRDFKPDNVLVDHTGRARVVDFGLARLQGDAAVGNDGIRSDRVSGSPRSALQTPLTGEGGIAGTPGYMSPEQARGAGVDARSDQFSFCVALYEALYRRAPFPRQDVAGARNPGQPLPPPTDSPVPIEVFQALSRGLSVDPSARFASMTELIVALTPSSTREGSAGKALRRSMTLLGVLVVGLYAAFYGIKNERSPITLRELTQNTGFLVLITAVASASVWRKLRVHALHREIAIRALCFIGTTFLIRGLGLFLHLDARTVLPLDLAAAGGLVTGYAYPSLPLLWALAVGFELAALAAALWPQHGLWIANLAYSVFGCSLYLAWAYTARRSDAAPDARS